MIITPIRATIHYDDLSKLWHLKASREEISSPNDIKPWIDFLGDFANLSVLIIQLLDLWASTGTTTQAPVGDLTHLAADITGRIGAYTETVPTITPGTPVFPGDEFEADPYDGIHDTPHWGTTP